MNYYIESWNGAEMQATARCYEKINFNEEGTR
jgi:hypothetical protein